MAYQIGWTMTTRVIRREVTQVLTFQLDQTLSIREQCERLLIHRVKGVPSEWGVMVDDHLLEIATNELATTVSYGTKLFASVSVHAAYNVVGYLIGDVLLAVNLAERLADDPIISLFRHVDILGLPFQIVVETRSTAPMMNIQIVDSRIEGVLQYTAKPAFYPRYAPLCAHLISGRIIPLYPPTEVKAPTKVEASTSSDSSRSPGSQSKTAFESLASSPSKGDDILTALLQPVESSETSSTPQSQAEPVFEPPALPGPHTLSIGGTRATTPVRTKERDLTLSETELLLIDPLHGMEKKLRLQRIVSEIQRMIGLIVTKESSIAVVNGEIPFGGKMGGSVSGREKYSAVIEFLPIESCKVEFTRRTSGKVKEREFTLIHVPSIPPFEAIAALVEWSSSVFPLVRVIPPTTAQVDWFVEDVKDLVHFHHLLAKANRQVYGEVHSKGQKTSGELVKEHLAVGEKIRDGLSCPLGPARKTEGGGDSTEIPLDGYPNDAKPSTRTRKGRTSRSIQI